MRPTTKFAKLGNDRVGYQVLGDGPIDLVFLTGMSSHIDLRWEEPLNEYFLHRLASFSRLILFDRRGAGVSDPGVLFTDIVDSTDLAVSMGDRRWKAVLETHDEIVRDHVARLQGRFIESTGDGALATFDRPGRAIRAAAAIQESIRALGIGIRAGLHAGEIELREGGHRVGGIAVHIAARVTALAVPGEILVSSTVKDLVAGSEIEFSDRGVHDLKGVPGAWRLFAVEARRLS